MFVRLARSSDIPDVVAMARDACAESWPHHVFDGEKLTGVLEIGLTGENPTTFVCEQNEKLIGFQVCYALEYIFTDGFQTIPWVTYILPRKRGSRAFGLLMVNFIQWSDGHGAKENAGGNSNGLQTYQTAKALMRFGYEPCGIGLVRRRGAKACPTLSGH